MPRAACERKRGGVPPAVKAGRVALGLHDFDSPLRAYVSACATISQALGNVKRIVSTSIAKKSGRS